MRPEFENFAENFGGQSPNEGFIREDLRSFEFETSDLCLEDSDCLVDFNYFEGSSSWVT